MKRVFNNNRLIALAFFTVFSLAMAPTVLANESNPVPVELKFLGKIKSQSLFQLNFNGNAEENFFSINILDESGNNLYSENIKGEVFSKRFLFNSDELGDNPIRITVTNRKTKKTVMFEISKKSSFVEEMLISKL